MLGFPLREQVVRKSVDAVSIAKSTIPLVDIEIYIQPVSFWLVAT